MEEFRKDRSTRREVWYDENLVPWSTAAGIALRETGADVDLVEQWRDFTDDRDAETGPGDWVTYGQWVEGELSVSIEQGHGTTMSPADWIQHYDWIRRMWLELAKVTEEHHDRDGASATELELQAQRRAARVEEAIADSTREYIIGVPGQLFARWDGERVLGWGFYPPNVAEPDFQYLDGPGDLPDCLRLNDYGSGFWLHLQQYLQTVLRASGESAMAVVWHEDGWRCRPAE